MRSLVGVVLGAAVLAGCAGRCRVRCAPCPPPVGCAPAPGSIGPASAAALGRAHGRGSRAIWSWMRSRYDADRDGRVVRGEYPRAEATFKRLDRDGDGALSASDFEGPTRMDVYIATLVVERIGHDPAEAPPDDDTPGIPVLSEATVRRAFERVDANRNGLAGEAELDRALASAQTVPAEGVLDLPGGVRPFPSFLATMDDDRSGRVSLAEALAWREQRAAEAEAAWKEAKPATPPRRPEAPAIGEPAPDLDLPTVQGSARVALSSFRGVKPVALVFGSFTCPPFRHTAPGIRRAFLRHGRDVQFLFVYVREAHAVDGRAPMPAEDQPLVEEPMDVAERAAAATECRIALGFGGFPALVDGMDGAVDRAYAASPVRLYVVDREGNVTYRSEPGPFGLDAPAFEAAVAAAAAAPRETASPRP